MFFKKNINESKKVIDNSCWIVFSFWSFLLLLNSFYEFFYDKRLIESSFVILISGLLIFYISYFIIKKITKK